MDNWISVKDKEPEENKSVILCYEYGIVDVGFRLFNLYYDQVYNIYPFVTHWQPLPEPPKVHTQEEINAWDSVE